MKFAKIYAALLFYFTAEILVRRWAWNQIPTPVSAAFTYGLVALNLIVIVNIFKQPSQR